MTKPSRAKRLALDAAEAAEVRAYQTHPDVLALRIERVRSQVDWICWSGIVLGLAFTMTNVQEFASAGTRAWSLPWWPRGCSIRLCRSCCWRSCGPSK